MANPGLAFETSAKQGMWQARALQALLRYLRERSPFYRPRLADINVKAIENLAALSKITTTAKQDLAAGWERFLCVPRSDIGEYFSTSGTIGKPVTIALTDGDLQRLAYNEQQSFRIAGCSEDDVFQLMLTLDKQFMAGMAYYSGIRALGGTVVRTGPGLPAAQWEAAKNAETTTLVCVPSFLLKMRQWGVENGIDPGSLRRAICIGEPVRRADLSPNTLAGAIAAAGNIALHGTYASTEMQTAFTECGAGMGGHQQPDLIITEILDEDGNAVPDGMPGEVTITTLGVQGMPLLRYRTGDICARHSETCDCGRHSPRLGPVIGRKSQAIKYKGTTLYPQAVFEALQSVPAVHSYVLSAAQDEHGMDLLVLHIHTGISEESCTDVLRAVLQSQLRVMPVLHFHSEEEIRHMQMPNGSRKVRRFIDKRPGIESI